MPAELEFHAEGAQYSAVLCGRYLEVFNTTHTAHTSSKCTEQGTHSEDDSSSMRRAQRTIRRLVNCNGLLYMNTLTYAVDHPEYFKGEKPFNLVPIDMQKDREHVIDDWSKFIRKLKNHYSHKGMYFKYLCVIEKHTGKRAKDTTVKSGTYHIHFLTGIPIEKRRLQHIWGHGFSNTSDWSKGRKKRDLDTNDTLPPPDNPGAYLSKYISKDESSPNKKRYWCSKNLSKPVQLDRNEFEWISGDVIWNKERIVDTEEGEFCVQQKTILLPDDSLYIRKKRIVRFHRTHRDKVNYYNVRRARHAAIIERSRVYERSKKLYSRASDKHIEKHIGRKRALYEASKAIY
jgi:hypothetical protein